MRQFINQNYKNRPTKKGYKKRAEKFCRFVKDSGYTANQVRKTPKEIIQQYADSLLESGLSADTIHTYISLPYAFFDINMAEINKPFRSASRITKSRGIGNSQGKRERTQEKYSRLTEFQRRVGIRRTELKKLTGKNLVTDESGCLCVEVTRGKGGKYQLQRILPQDIQFVSGYFDGSDNLVFTSREMKNKIDLHSMRSAQARRAYDYYADICRTKEGTGRLKQQMIDRFTAYNIKYLNAPPARKNRLLAAFEKEISGVYKLRKDTRQLAQEKNRPVVYNRTAVMAVSVFHLSHWRCDVTVSNYLLA